MLPVGTLQKSSVLLVFLRLNTSLDAFLYVVIDLIWLVLLNATSLNGPKLLLTLEM